MLKLKTKWFNKWAKKNSISDNILLKTLEDISKNLNIVNLGAGLCKVRTPRTDGFVKSPTAALRFIFRHCGVPVSTPHSLRFASLAFGAFYFAVPILTFYEFIKNGKRKKQWV